MKGKLIVIDGPDGSGKKTQFDLLVKALEAKNIPFATKDFPQYGKKSAGAVEEYLNGVYGNPKQVGPYRASIFFAIDRYDASFEMRHWLEEGRVVLCNRYVTANMAHQGGKIEDPKVRQGYFEWIKELEFNLFGIPQPDANIFLHVPAEISQQLVDKKGHRDYVGGEKRDIHEADINHLRDTIRVYLELSRILPNAKLIECAPDGTLLTPETIHKKIWAIVEKELA